MTYSEFLKSKVKKYNPSGFDVTPELVKSRYPFLFDWQRHIMPWLIKRGRAALFLDTGLGKTIIQLVWADIVCRHTGGNVIILAPLAVSAQTVREAARFGINVTPCRSQADVKPGINITNYEMLDKFDAAGFVGVILDESSILKNYMGSTKQMIIDTFRDTPYKLAATATPSPNSPMELLNQSEFLGVMKRSSALSVWFVHDSANTSDYRLKGHAVKSFWEWVSSWAVYISKPSEIGFSDEGYNLPSLNEKEVIIPIDETSDNIDDGFFRHIDTSATAFHKEKRFTAEARAEKCAEIAAKYPEEQFVIWCYTDYEADFLKKFIPEAVEVRGSHKPEYKEQAAMDFISGKIRVLISKPRIFGMGLNFQNCHNTIFCGTDFSYESYYQTVRRFYRFGQKNEVNVYIVIGSTEQRILSAVREKEKLQQEMKMGIKNQIREYQNAELKQRDTVLNFDTPKIELPAWVKGA